MSDEKKDKDNEHGPIVEVADLNTNREVKFHAAWSTTLGAIFDRAYRELQEARIDGDEFVCQAGPSLMAHLQLTLEQARERRLCPDRKFAIRRPTGGADGKIRPGMKPVANTPADAIAALDSHLPLVTRGRSLAELGWERPDPLTLFVPMHGHAVDGSVDEYLLKLGFGHYPDWPPSAQFVNPSTRTYAKGQDERWLPRIVDPSNEIKTHADYNREQQLICCSTTLEFYAVGHSFKPEHGWDPATQNLAATLNAIERGLRPPLYRGPWVPRA